MADSKSKSESRRERMIKEGALRPEATPTGVPPKSGAGGVTQSTKSDSPGSGSDGAGGSGGSSSENGD